MAATVESPQKEAAAEAAQRLGSGVPVVKAIVVGQDVEPPASIQDEQSTIFSEFQGEGLLDPPYNPEQLLRIWENSSSLGQNIDSYATNIDGLGFRLTARFDLDSEEAYERVRDDLWVERIRREESISEEPIDYEALMPTDEEVDARIHSLKTRERLERARLLSFFEFVSPIGSFESLRRQTRHDLEITGNAYWEVVRNKRGEIARFVLVPPTHVRCTRQDEEPTTVHERVLVGMTREVVKQPRFFRRYVQAFGNKFIWFKEFGDPRVISRESGRIYKDTAEFVEKAPKGEHRATELVHFKIHKTGEAYGVPRWIGALLSVLGSRAADEVNVDYFDNKAVPPLALKVQGGRLDDDSVERITNYVRDHVKGRKNFHSILVIQTDDDPMGGLGNPKLEFEKLTDAQQGDALFQRYDERNIDKVGSTFRLPRLLRGDVRDFNRATASASLQFADEQVFEPERKEFDSWLNRVILPELNVSLWLFRSLGPQTRDPEKLATIIVELVKAGVITANEAREIVGALLDRDIDPIEEFWANQPLQMTLAGYVPPQGGEGEDEAGNNDEDISRRAWGQLRLLRGALVGNADRDRAVDDALREAERRQNEIAERHAEYLDREEAIGGDH